MLVIEKGTPGFEVSRKLAKMGWRSSDTAELSFTDARVPVENLVGAENTGFLQIAQAFVSERVGLAVQAYSSAQRCLDITVAWCRDRETFGKPLLTRQVIRHKLVDMLTHIEPVRCWLYELARRVDAGEWPIAKLCMLKNAATACVEHCARDGVQILGGAGYMRGTRVERIFRETKVLAIGGGAEEIMKDLAARQLGW